MQLPAFRAAKMGAFDTVTAIFGEPVIWTTAPGGPETGRALFKEPTQGEVYAPHARSTDGAEYDVAEPMIEFRAGVFARLQGEVDNNRTTQILEIRGRRFAVGAVKKKFDGEYLRALLQELDLDAV